MRGFVPLIQYSNPLGFKVILITLVLFFLMYVCISGVRCAVFVAGVCDSAQRLLG
jgi:hypothetical protein